MSATQCGRIQLVSSRGYNNYDRFKDYGLAVHGNSSPIN